MHARTGKISFGIFPVQIKRQGARNHELGPKIFVVHQIWETRVVPKSKSITDEPNPIPDDPETTRCFGYSGEIEVCTRSESV